MVVVETSDIIFDHNLNEATEIVFFSSKAYDIRGIINELLELIVSCYRMENMRIGYFRVDDKGMGIEIFPLRILVSVSLS